MVKQCITTECVCDLPEDLLEKLNVDIIYFHIYTESGCFKDTDEINAQNILEYMENGGTISKSEAPGANEYKRFFQKKLEDYDEVIHIAISSGISNSVNNSSLAIARMGAQGMKIHVFDSKHLSSGMGFMVIKAAKMSREGCSTKEILDELEHMKSLVSTSFMVKNADYLFRNGKINKHVRNLCNAFSFHPILYMKDGVLTLKGLEIGNYQRASRRYVKKQLRHRKRIQKNCLFITHANCPIRKIQQIEKTVQDCCKFQEIIVNSASATVSSNCGPEAFGVLFVLKKGGNII